MRKILASLNDPATIEKLEDEYREAFINTTEEEFMVNELASEPKDQDDLDLHDHLGMRGFEKMPTSEYLRLLHLPPGPFPFTCPWLGPGGKPATLFDDYDPSLPDEELLEKGFTKLYPHWHQLGSTVAIMDRMVKKENVILADGTGVGKTFECLLLFAYLRHLCVLQEDGDVGNFPLGKHFRKLKRPDAKNPHSSLANDIGFGILGRPTMKEDQFSFSAEEDLPFVSNDSYLITCPNMLVEQWMEEASKFLDKSAWQILVYPKDNKGREEFWNTTWKNAGKAHTRILIVPHSVSGHLLLLLSRSSDRVRRLHTRARSVCNARSRGSPFLCV